MQNRIFCIDNQSNKYCVKSVLYMTCYTTQWHISNLIPLEYFASYTTAEMNSKTFHLPNTWHNKHLIKISPNGCKAEKNAYTNVTWICQLNIFAPNNSVMPTGV